MRTAVTMSLALAHALELPGKLRLGKEEYCAVQTIDYSGFTIAGAAEIGSTIRSLVTVDADAQDGPTILARAPPSPAWSRSRSPSGA